MQLSLNDLIQGAGCSNKVAEVWLPYFNSIPKNLPYLNNLYFELNHLDLAAYFNPSTSSSVFFLDEIEDP